MVVLPNMDSTDKPRIPRAAVSYVRNVTAGRGVVRVGFASVKPRCQVERITH